VLHGEPLGEPATALEERHGASAGDMFDLTVLVDLPGTNAVSWTPELGGERVELDASTTIYDIPRLVLATVAVLCAVGLLVVFVVRTLRTARERAPATSGYRPTRSHDE
jgi:hypothetical protein